MKTKHELARLNKKGFSCLNSVGGFGYHRHRIRQVITKQLNMHLRFCPTNLSILSSKVNLINFNNLLTFQLMLIMLLLISQLTNCFVKSNFTNNNDTTVNNKLISDLSIVSTNNANGSQITENLNPSKPLFDSLAQSSETNKDSNITMKNSNTTRQLSNFNTNSNTNLNSIDEDGERDLILGISITNALIFVIGLCGNTVVIIVILRFTKIETVTDIYILNLAFADLMFIMGLIFLITTMSIEHWIFGNLMCKLYMATTSLNQFASSLLLVVMSFDRFLAVCHPIYAQRFRRPRRAKIICLCIWIVCLILMTPIFAFAKINKDLTCAIFWPEHNSINCEMAFTLYSFAIGFAVPLLLIAGFYICVIKRLRTAANAPILSLGSTRRSRSRETTNRRIEHLVIGIICTYTICWLPYWITQLCVSFSTGEHSPMIGFYEFVLVATCLSYTNSALNPILYAFLSDNFKRRCSEIFRPIHSIGFRKRSHDIHQTNSNAYCESEISRPESRLTVLPSETSRFITSSAYKKNNSSNKKGDNNSNKSNNKNVNSNNKKTKFEITNGLISDLAPANQEIDANELLNVPINDRSQENKKRSVAFKRNTIVVEHAKESGCINCHSCECDDV